MNSDRFILTAIILTITGLTGLRAQMMYVKEKSGAQTTYTLSNISKITFSAGNLKVHKTDQTIAQHGLNELQYLSFTNFTMGIEEPEKASVIPYPNPVKDLLHIDLPGSEYFCGSISILSLEGKVLQKQEVRGAGTITLNLNSLPQGIYLCRIANDKKIKTIKIIKQ